MCDLNGAKPNQQTLVAADFIPAPQLGGSDHETVSYLDFLAGIPVVCVDLYDRLVSQVFPSPVCHIALVAHNSFCSVAL